MIRFLALGLLGSLLACGGTVTTHARVTEGPLAELPPDWRTMSEPAFEAFALSREPSELSDSTLAALANELASESTTAVRAAVLLARSRDARAREVILRRLEERVLGSTREADAGDCVAAASLRDWKLESAELDRIAPLVQSDRPHPDVEVRTELAAVLAFAEDRRGVPFLLRVLREGTLAQDEAVEWERKPQMAWSKSRAAEALSALAGVECVYQEDGSFEAMEREAARLEALLTD